MIPSKIIFRYLKRIISGQLVGSLVLFSALEIEITLDPLNFLSIKEIYIDNFIKYLDCFRRNIFDHSYRYLIGPGLSLFFSFEMNSFIYSSEVYNSLLKPALD